MAKGSEKKATNQMINTNYSQNQTEHNEDRTRNNNWADENHNRQSETYNTLSGGLTNFANTGGLDATTMANMRTLLGQSNSGGGGGYTGAGLEDLYGKAVTGGTLNMDRLRSAVPTLTELMNTGGYGDAEKALINKDINSLRTIGNDQYAGIAAGDVNRMRGNGVFDEFARDGGVNDSTKAMLRAKGTSVIPSMYGNIKSEANRLNKVGGGSNPGQAALMSRLARSQGRDMQSAALDTELGIVDRVNQGRQWGAEGSSQSENALQGLVVPARQNALNSALSNSRGMEEFIASMRLNSGMGLSDVEQKAESMLTDERRWGASNLENSAARANAASSAASNAKAGSARDMLDLEKYFLEYGNDNKMAGLSGLGGLYGDTSAQNSQYLDRSLAERGLTQDAAGGSIQQRMANNPSFDWNTFLGNALGAGAGVASGIWGGSTKRAGG